MIWNIYIIFCQNFKGQLISKKILKPRILQKKRTNKFVFTSMRRVFVCFLRESSARKKSFEIIWPLKKAETFYSWRSRMPKKIRHWLELVWKKCFVSRGTVTSIMKSRNWSMKFNFWKMLCQIERLLDWIKYGNLIILKKKERRSLFCSSPYSHSRTTSVKIRQSSV